MYTQLCRLVRNRHTSLLGPDEMNTNNIYSNRSVVALSTLLQVLEDNSCLPVAASVKFINMSTSIITSSELRYDILESIHFLKIGRAPIDMEQFKKTLQHTTTLGSTNTVTSFNAKDKLLNKLNEILSTSLPSQQIFDATTSNKRPSSPSTTAPIHDVLMMRS